MAAQRKSPLHVNYGLLGSNGVPATLVQLLPVCVSKIIIRSLFGIADI
jgi:hypothetical protein